MIEMFLATGVIQFTVSIWNPEALWEWKPRVNSDAHRVEELGLPTMFQWPQEKILTVMFLCTGMDKPAVTAGVILSNHNHTWARSGQLPLNIQTWMSLMHSSLALQSYLMMIQNKDLLINQICVKNVQKVVVLATPCHFHCSNDFQWLIIIVMTMYVTTTTV